MNLVIGEVEYPLTEAITEAKLADLVTVARESKKLGHEMNLKRLREYVVNDLIKSMDGFAFVEGYERLIAFYALVYLCRRHVGEETSFDSASEISLDRLRLSVSVDDEITPGEADPKDPTDSAPAGAPSAATI